MIKEELKQEAEEWLNKWELCNKCENKVDCISNFSYCKKVVLQSYLASAEPREKRITTLEKKNAELKEKLKPENCLITFLFCVVISSPLRSMLKTFEF
jgi:predicted ATP-binding protein involved in virulence